MLQAPLVASRRPLIYRGRVNDEVSAIVEMLGLAPHPEGGFFRETLRASLEIGTPDGQRAASTAIYYLLASGTFSALHRVRSDEVWHHYDGDPVALHLLHEDGTHAVVTLGRALQNGERPQHVVPAGVWQAAIPLGGRFALCGCTVSPGFDFADFEMPTRAELIFRMPGLRTTIEQLTRG